MTKQDYIKKYSTYWNDAEEMYEQIQKKMKDFGSISFVQTYFSRQIRNVSLQAIADACGKRL